MSLCVRCGQNIDCGGKIVAPTSKGRESKDNAIKDRGDTMFVSEGQALHEECRRNYTNKHNIRAYLRNKQTESASRVTKNLRLQTYHFEFSSCCIFSGMKADLNAHTGSKVYLVRTLEFQSPKFLIYQTLYIIRLAVETSETERGCPGLCHTMM